jgi:flagellar M-ring protein FliF
LVLTVLRPLVRNLITLPRAERLANPVPAGAGSAMLAPGAAATLLDPAQQLSQARALVTQDPKRVAQVVRGWVEQDG